MSATALRWPASDRRNLYDAEVEDLLKDFEDTAETLFEKDTDLNVTIREYRQGVLPTIDTYETTQQINDYVKQPKQPGTTRIISIPQLFSYSELEISKTAIQALFSHLRISPGFWTVVKLFGQKDNCVHESAGGFNEETWEHFSQSFGFSYSVKHVEENGRKDTYDPWSMRQIGIHHEYNDDTQENTFILLNPSKALSKRLQHVTESTEPIDVHRLILSSVTERWNDYLAYLEFSFNEISKKGVLSNPHAAKSGKDRTVEVRFSDSQRIQKLQDTILRVSHMLDLNLSVFEHILTHSEIFTKTVIVEGESNKSHIAGLSTLATQTRVRQRRAENLLRRLEGSSSLVRSILDAQALETLQASSRTNNELAALAREDSKQATKDARTLNTITILGFIYLPASFVATLLGTQYIHVNTHPTSLYLDPEMWIFLLLTIILLLVTAGSWLLWERQKRIEDEKEEQAKSV